MSWLCVASGPSLSASDCVRAELAIRSGKLRAIAVNDNWRRVPSADVLYAPDRKWWALHYAAVAERFGGELWTTTRKAAEEFGLHMIESRNGTAPLPLDSGAISRGANGGFQAIMLARYFGARRILLLGFDMQRTDGRAHWFGDHPKPLVQGKPEGWVKYFDAAAPALAAEGIEVINCSRATALRCFPLGDLAVELARL